MRYKLAALVLVLGVLLCGCSVWPDGSYVSVKPHTEQGYGDTKEVTSVATYSQIRTALSDMVEGGMEYHVLSAQKMNEQTLNTYITRAITYVMQEHPVGAYAVEEITYEIGSGIGSMAVAVNIHYSRGKAELESIKKVKDADAAQALLIRALEQCETGVVMQVEKYSSTDYVQLVENYARDHPEAVMELPQVTVNMYPDSGNERVVEIIFSYQTSRDCLRSMKSYVQPVFSSAALYVSGEGEEAVKFSQLYSFLMERNDYKLETSITQAYSLLRHGVGDSRAFANVYASMCRRAGLECQVVSGTRAGEPWFWNIICEDGIYYHVDLVQSHRFGGYAKKTDGEMTGYVWDYSAYPVCAITP